MENFSTVRTQALAMERAGQNPTALELYGRLLKDPAGNRDGSIWARAGKLQATMGQRALATDSYATAVERYAEANHWNLALSFCKRLLQIDETRSEFLLRFGELSAHQGYRRDARLGYFDYADNAVERGEPSAAIEALRAFLARFPDDDAARQRISRLTGVPEPIPASVPTTRATSPGEDLPSSASPVAMLEGLEPTSVALEPLSAGDAGAAEGHSLLGDDEERGDVISPVELPPLSEDDDAGHAEEQGVPLPLLEPTDVAPLPPREALSAVQGRQLPTASPAQAGRESVVAAPVHDYIDLAELILADVPNEETRFQVAVGDPSGNEESDFAEILELFRRKVSENLDPKDAASHYDLGLAFKEMGLLEDAIVHFQSALRGGSNPLATLEMLGECFVAKGQISLASRVFERATRLDGVGDSELVGVLYGLARCQQDLAELDGARTSFERVVAVDLSFRDAAERLQALELR